jgi:hypothetical protein
MEDTLVIGFTGTRQGMTWEQRLAVEHLLNKLQPAQVRHGDCVGADEQFHEISRQLELPVFIHPPNNNKERAYCMGAVAIAPPAPYHVRNKDMVASSDALVATPLEDSEQDRGGTWMTVRFARAKGIPLYIVWPNGIVWEENVT